MAEKVLVEMKTRSTLTDDYLAQTRSYLKACKQEVAILVNFGERSLVLKRLILTKIK